ncbi:MAG: tRNA glutamyl-Q(34) synthetase GluQRS [Gammaproteobacteria bacterium]|nr:MAG: tRNA glutamyl-Q(34) synthetase GluQRS [Gammaproteobacteria bacterium]
MDNENNKKKIITRFAPTPSGFLHIGNIVAAMISYLYIKKNNGKWLLRIDDLDYHRCRQNYLEFTLKSLEKLGFEHNSKIYYQSHYNEDYKFYLNLLKQKNMLYGCDCTRPLIKQHSAQGEHGYVYSGFCKDKNITEKNSALRIKSPDKMWQFNDLILGTQQQNIKQDLGDFVIKRKDGIMAYLFTNVIDDYNMKITHSIKGADLLFSVATQQFLKQIFNFSSIKFAHFDLIKNNNNIKLSKSTSATGIDIKNPIKTLIQAYNLINNSNKILSADFDSVDDFWQYAILNY